MFVRLVSSLIVRMELICIITFISQSDIKVLNESSQSTTGDEVKQLLVDCTASCLALNDLYFSTDVEEYPWIQFDFNEIRILFGARAYLRVDSFKHKQSKLIILREIEYSQLY